jgi:hypothetical protein
MRPRVPLRLLPLLLAASASLAAQTATVRGPDNSGSSEKVEAIEVLPLPGQPFFANTTITLTHPLADGGSIVFSGSSKTVRDIQGRVYLERRHLSPSANADSEAVLTEFVILDPAARTRTTCVVSSHICRIKEYQSPVAPPLAPVGPFDAGKRYRSREQLERSTVSTPSEPEKPSP